MAEGRSILGMPLSNQSPLLIAHRGLSHDYPENTWLAFDRALELGVEMIELDVALTCDGHLMVIHDDTLTRTTNGKGFVCHQTRAELEALDAGHWFSHVGEGQRIPALEEVLQRLAPKVALNVEIKPFYPLHRAQQMQAALLAFLKQVKAQGLYDNILISSVNYFVLELLRELDDDIQLGLIYRRPLTDFDPAMACAELRATSLHPYEKQTDQALVASMHDIGVKVYAYTVNDIEHLRQLMAIDVDGVFTDMPGRLREALGASGA